MKAPNHVLCILNSLRTDLQTWNHFVYCLIILSMSSPEQWWNSLPIISKSVLLGVTVTTILASLELVPVKAIVFLPDLIFNKFQIWRLLTNFLFVGEFSFGWIFTMMMFARYIVDLESSWFGSAHGTADFLFMMLFGCFFMLMSSIVLQNLFVYGPSLILYIIHVWARKSPFVPVNVYGFTISAWHLPFLLLIFHALMGGGMSAVLRDGLGIIVGHLYHFLVDIVPKVYRVSVLKTPQLLIDIVEIHVPKMMSWFTGRPVAGVQYQPDWRRSGGYRLN